VEGTLTGAVGEPAVVAMLCRTSDRDPGGSAGSRALAEAIGERLGVDPRLVGSPGEAHDGRYDDDLRDSHGCLLEAGGQIDDALDAGRYPVMLAADCSVCVSTLPAVVRRHPDAWILWLDAHGDFNTPDTTPSGFLGGMCLAGACGLWDTGHGGGVDPARVVMCGVRNLDGPERVLLDTSGVVNVERPGELADALRGREVFVHLDVDVIDPSAMPGQRYPAPGGLSDGGLRNLLGEVADAARLVGVEITCFNAPDLARRMATIVEPLLP
jgi:arginase family enzyme